MSEIKIDENESSTKVINNIHFVNKFRPGLLDKILVSNIYHKGN